MKETKALFFCSFGIFRINSNLAVREHRLLQRRFGVTVKGRSEMENMEKKKKNELEDIETFLKLNEYPKTIKYLGARSSLDCLKWACKNFSVKNGQFLYKRQRVRGMAKQQPLKIIKIVYEGVRQSTRSKAMASHKDRFNLFKKFRALILVFKL